MQLSNNDTLNTLKSQFNTAWSLFAYHINGLTDEECLWKPCENGLSVNSTEHGWVADFPDSEEYTIGPPNIAWLLWHIKYWWSMALDHSFGGGTLTREAVLWSGTAKNSVCEIEHLRDIWLKKLDELSADELHGTANVKFPFENRSFFDLIAWLNLELMKNASELGYCRFLYANRK